MANKNAAKLEAQQQISPYLYQFLLEQSPGAKKERKKTTANLRPGAIKQGLFAGNTLQNTDAFSHLQTIASGRAATRASADTMYGIKLQKQQQAAAELAYKKQQEQLRKQLAAIAKQAAASQNQGVTPRPNLPIPGRPTVPGSPTVPGGGNGQTILPPVVASGQDKRNADMNQWACDKYGACPPGYTRRTYISAPPKDNRSLLDKLKGLF